MGPRRCRDRSQHLYHALLIRDADNARRLPGKDRRSTEPTCPLAPLYGIIWTYQRS